MMLRTAAARPARRGFTLIELMVAAAVCVIIMTILAVCFQAGLDTLRQLRAQGDMMDQIRAAGEVMKRDFQADHFLPEEGRPNRGRRVSDYRFDLGATGPRTGFYQLNSPQTVDEGYDGNLFSASRGGHFVWFTSVLSGQSEADVYTTSTPAAAAMVGSPQLSSEAAEVAYFLGSPAGFGQPTGTTSGGTIPVFNLYRRQRLVSPSAGQQSTFQRVVNQGQVGTDPGVTDVISTVTGGTPATTTANTMAGVANGLRPPNAAGTTIFTPLGGSRFGDDILLSNVISFEARPTWVVPANRAAGATPFPPNVFAGNTDHPYDNLTTATNSATAFTFDTVGGPNANLQIRVLAVQVHVRVYDTKLKTARQATFVFDQ